MNAKRIMASVLPLLVIAFTVGGTVTPSSARSGGRGGGESVRSSARGGAEVVARQGGRGIVTRTPGRGGYVGRGGYSTRYLGHRHSHSHFSGSIWVGPGWGLWDPFYYPYYPYRYYYSPPTVVVPQEPQEYVAPEPQQEETGYWYFCRKPEGFYPYVERCPSGWLKVVPDTTPPGEEQDDEEKAND